MSKAFTKDEGEGSEAPVLPVGVPLPVGAKNYMTPEGANVLREQRRQALAEVERVRGLGQPAALTQAQERLRFLTERLEALEEVAPPQAPVDRVRFGARILAVDEDGQQRRYRIVGVDEAAPARGDVSWTSPIARALTGHEVGDEVQVRTPQGLLTLEIQALS